MLAVFDCFFAIKSWFFSVLILTYLIPLRCYDATMLHKRFLWKSCVKIQMAQKLVANEKVVKIRELSKQSFCGNVLITLQIKLRQKGGEGSAPLATPLWSMLCLCRQYAMLPKNGQKVDALFL